MHILVLTRYSSLGASSRYRFYQYIPYFQEQGWETTIQPLLGDRYINFLYKKGRLPFFEIVKKYAERIGYLLNKKKYDIIWLQQEAFPWLPAWIERFFLKSDTPIIVDYDDAFFHRYDQSKHPFIRFTLGKKIDKVMSIADVVIVGNEYLANRAKENNDKNVIIVPTVVDINRYRTVGSTIDHPFTVGWIGSPQTVKYVKNIQNVLQELSEQRDVRIVMVGAGEHNFDNSSFEIRKWSESTEVADIQSFDIGIMPLLDSPWEKGKCGFKLIQYMACGKPVIASPVGVNVNIIIDGVNGYLAKDKEEWIKYLRILKGDASLRNKMGIEGRKLVEEKYSLQVIAPVLVQIFNNYNKNYHE